MSPIQETMLIRLGLDRTFMGWHLVRRLGIIGGTWADLAASLGLTMDKMISLAWCKSPRPDHREEDIQVIAAYVGVSPDALADLFQPENPNAQKP